MSLPEFKCLGIEKHLLLLFSNWLKLSSIKPNQVIAGYITLCNFEPYLKDAIKKNQVRYKGPGYPREKHR